MGHKYSFSKDIKIVLQGGVINIGGGEEGNAKEGRVNLKEVLFEMHLRKFIVL